MSNIVRHGAHTSVPLSAAVEAGGFIFLSGQLPFGPGGTLPGGDIAAQTRRTMENIEAALAPLGAGLSDIVKVTVFLTHAEGFAGFNEAYRGFFPDRRPRAQPWSPSFCSTPASRSRPSPGSRPDRLRRARNY